jgi:hypothetical protein
VEWGVSKIAHGQSLHGHPLGRSSVVVAGQPLNGSDITAILEEMGSEGVAKKYDRPGEDDSVAPYRADPEAVLADVRSRGGAVLHFDKIGLARIDR